MTDRPDDHERFEGVLRALYELSCNGDQQWFSWNTVAHQWQGTADEAPLAWGLVQQYDKSAPKYCALQGDMRVKLTHEGIQHVAQEPETSTNPTRASSPKAVAKALREYGRSLKDLSINILGVAAVGKGGGRFVQALQLEMSDTRFATSTRVQIQPNDRSAWTDGTIVGQEPDEMRVYVATDTDITPNSLPARLRVDRGFLLHQLAKQIEELPATPPRVRSFLGTETGTGSAISAENSAAAVMELLGLERPWTRFLWGPPGAGKTFAIARFVSALLQERPDDRILLVAPSNLAVDVLTWELVQELRKARLGSLVEERKILRYGYPRMPEILTCKALSGPAAAADLAGVISTASQKLRSAERGQTDEADIAKLRAQLFGHQEALKAMVEGHAGEARVVTTSTTLGFLPTSAVGGKSWDLVVIDEATMVPPALCYYLGSLAKSKNSALLLAGDPRQLGPVFEEGPKTPDSAWKWAGRDVFEAAKISSGAGVDRTVDLQHHLLLNVLEQRRCAPAIWNIVEHLYPDVCSNPPSQSPSAMWPFKSRLVVLDTHDVALGAYKPEKKSHRNDASAHVSVELATSLIGDDDTGAASVAIIAPFAAQVRNITGRLRSERAEFEDFERIKIGTVHQFQGSAADVVIFDLVWGSYTKDLSRFLSGDSGIRLVTVAATRAKLGLIVVADRTHFRKQVDPDANPILWSLIVDRNPDEVIKVVSAFPETGPIQRLDSPHEAKFDEIIHAHSEFEELRSLKAQFDIRREDGSLISRADWAEPDLKYAYYIDGATHHLSPSGWRRDRRLRAELRERGWALRVDPAWRIAAAAVDCARVVLDDIRRLRNQSPEVPESPVQE